MGVILSGATSVAPSLSPQRRAAISRQEVAVARTKAIADEAQTKADAAVAPDGAVPNCVEGCKGIALPSHLIMARLKKLNANLWFEVANSDSSKMGCYVLRPSLEGGNEKVFLCGFERGTNPEFTSRVMEGERIKIVRGYRTLLSRLIRQKLVTETGISSMFGPPSRDSENWARFTT